MTRKNSLLLAVAAAVVAVAAFYFLALAPKRDEIAKLDADIATKATELEQARMTLATYEQARGTYKQNYATLVRLGKAVPADDDVRSLLVQLEATAASSGVDFQKIEVGGGAAASSDTGETPAAESELAKAPGTVDVAGGALSAMPFNFSFNGGYFELQTFLARLERFVTVNNERIDATGRLLRLESVKLAPGPDGFPQMRAEIGAATYVVPAPEPVAAAGAATATATPAAPSADATVPPTTTATATGGA
jgi:Tfp pilus assembly protein PilO